MAAATCQALFLAAPASGQGKTTVTAGLARLLRRRGLVVRVFKTGPDYLDPQVLEQASGQPVEQLDLWMCGEAWCQSRFHQVAKTADVILVEGAMGMFDGNPSSADLAVKFNMPVAIVMDVKGMAQTVGAVAAGLANYRDDVQVAGLIANNCGSDRHRELIEQSLSPEVPLLATVPRDPAMVLPERHLGIVQAAEIADELEQRFEAAADVLAGTGLAEALAALPPVSFPAVDVDAVSTGLEGVRIGIARDAAFSFIYDANLDLLRDMGAELTFFSPLQDAALPAVDALWLPGGYPELHARGLADNTAMLASMRQFHATGKPVLAECGGMLYCLDSLIDLEGEEYRLCGLMKGTGAMRGKRGCQGMQYAPLLQGEFRGHAHHRSRSSGTPEPVAHGRRPHHPAAGEAIYQVDGLSATYLHLFFPSNPGAIARLFAGDAVPKVVSDGS